MNMSLGITDIVIIILLAASIYKGIVNGLIKEALSLVAYFASGIIAYSLKGYFALFFLEFIKLPPEFSSLDSIRVMIAQTLAFIVLWFVIHIIFKLIINLISSIEKATIKGVTMYFAAALSFAKSYLVIFVVLFALSFFNTDFLKPVNESVSANIILNHTPFLSGYVNGTGNELKELIAKINAMIENGESIDFADLDFVSDFIKKNPSLISDFVDPEMVTNLLGSDININDLNNMIQSGDIDPDVVSSLITEDVVNMVLESGSLDLNQMRALYDSGQLDPDLIRTFATPVVVQALLDEGVFSKEELMTMYNNNEIVGEEILNILEEN
jgi:uncharacterized membrane protein required for colicin V production